MARLPYSRVVDVNLTRNDRFPTRRGFGIGLFLTAATKAGVVDATHLTKYYASIDEVAADFASNTEPYKAATVFFAQNPRPTGFKVGYIAAPTGADDAAKEADLVSKLNSLYDSDQSFYYVAVDSTMRDQPYLDGLVEWIEGKQKLALIDSNDENLEDDADDTNIAARHKGTVQRTAVFYHTDAAEYLSMAMMAYMATRNFDEANSRYTLKFKKAQLVSPVDIGSAALTAVTGFVEGVGQSSSAGHLANTYIDIGDQNFLVEGSTLTQNVFIDEIHASDWIVARTEEEMLALFLNNSSIQYTDQGMQQLASVPRTVMAAAVRAGLVANDINPTSGQYEPAVVITVPSVFDVSESQRKARVAPAIAVEFRYAGAVHYAVVNYNMTF